MFQGSIFSPTRQEAEIPAERLKKLAEKYLSDEEMKEIEALGWDKLMETSRNASPSKRAATLGGSKWIGTAGDVPLRRLWVAPGRDPHRPGQELHDKRAVKVWDKREFKDFDDTVELGTRNIKIALRRLRKFARTGAPDELDLDGTIRETASRGYLDLKLRPERRNAGLSSSTSAAPWTGTSGRPARSFFRYAQRIQAPRIFLLPQLPLRARVEG